MKHRSRHSFTAWACLAGLIMAAPGLAQYREYLLSGKVVDTENRPLAGVQISLRDVATSRSYAFKTNKEGLFKFAGLPHGVYRVVIRKEGYAEKIDEWRFETPQDTMQRVEIPAVVLVTQAAVQQAELMKEMQGEVKKAAEKIQAKDYAPALDILKAVLAKTPDDSNALFLVGLASARLKDVPSAIQALTEVTRLSPGFAAAYFELGILHQQQGNLPEALVCFQKTLELDPANPDSAYNSGLILFSQSRASEALAMFEKALALRPSDPAYLEMSGRCYINLAAVRKPDGAIEIDRGAFEKAIELLEKAKAGYAADPDKVTFLDGLLSMLREQIKKDSGPGGLDREARQS